MKPLFILIALIGMFFADSLLNAEQFVQAKELHTEEKLQRKNIRKFKEVQRDFNLRNYDKASKTLDELSESPKLNSLEKAYIANHRGNICFAKKNVSCSIASFESILTYKSSISQEFYFQMVKVLAQLYISEKKYAEAIRYAKLYLSSGLAPIGEASLLVAKSYYGAGDYENALLFALQNISSHKKGYGPLSRERIDFPIHIYKELNQLEGAYDFVESLDDVNPKIKYKLKIAQLYETLGMKEKAEVIQNKLVNEGLAGYNKEGQVIVWNSDGAWLPVFRPIPTYPRKALTRGQEGWVDLIMDVDKSGKTQNIRITGSSRKKTFDKSAKKSAEGYLYEPKIVNGEPVIVKDSEIRVSFKIGGQ